MLISPARDRPQMLADLTRLLETVRLQRPGLPTDTRVTVQIPEDELDALREACGAVFDQPLEWLLQLPVAATTQSALRLRA